MIDWHSHILPNIDDGSRSVEESLAMLDMLREQGVDTVIATPHFYANDESVEEFLKRRDEAYSLLKEKMSDDHPRILLGAEVKYYPGISRMEGLKKLSLKDSRILLVEMPFEKWTEYTVRELVELSGTGDMLVMMAHVERYLKLQKDAVWERLYESGAMMQVNASFFFSFAGRRKALSMLEFGDVRFIGSDAHNTTSRPPRLRKAYDIIEKKLGTDFVDHLNRYCDSVLAK